MSANFYDKVAKKFGDYHSSHHKHITEYPNGDPEKVFKEKLLELAGKNKIALDAGCADGYFTLLVAPYFKKVIAIDLSKGMLKAARKFQKEKKINNVSFEEQNAHHTNFDDISFDLVYSRRGPSDFKESFRLLKPCGYFIEIDIGEKDCQEIKEIFGRGQGFEKWDISRLNTVKKKVEQAGFKVVFAKEYFCEEYYVSYKDLDIFLQGVPIFEDFDSEKDKRFLEAYTAKFMTEKGIKLPRHRVVTVAKKI